VENRAPNTPARDRWIRIRMGILSGFLALGLGLVVSAGYSLMVEDGPAWRELAESQRQRRLHVLPKRGAVYDRNGSALAVSVEVPSVSMDAVELLRGVSAGQVPVVARDAANRIAQVLSLDAAQVERRILQKRRFAWLKRQISADEADKIRGLSSEGPFASRLRGLVVEGEGRRYYPRRELAGPLLGFVAPDGEGKDGLEFSFNEDLKGRVDKVSGLRDRSGRLLFADGIEDEQSADLAQWWAETFEVPGVISLPGATVDAVDPRGAEFLALSQSIWSATTPAETMAAIAAKLENAA
jgi:cell division protein FtsI (penicillin-binding protein 3)